MSRLSRGILSGDSRRTLWAVADQCAVSGGNFCTNLILLKTLPPAEFGTYALILNAIIFFNNVQQAFVSYPVCVRGARANPGQLRRILAFALVGTTLLILTLLGPALSVVGASLHQNAVIVAAVCAMLFWQLQDTLRAGFIAKLEQSRALAADVISYVGQAVLLGMICIRARPSLRVIFWTVAGTSLLALGVQCWQIRPSKPPLRTLRLLAQEFWFLGRWSVVAKLVGFLTLQAFPWLILMRHGRVEVAGFQAIFQFLAFTNPLLFSINGLITATVAKHGSYRTLSVRNYLLLATGAVGPYLLLLGFAGQDMMRVLYGVHSPYLAYAPLMRIFAAAWSFEVIAQLTTAILGGLREPRSLFVLQLSGAIAAVLIVLPWIYWKGLVAAAVGLVLVDAVRAGTGLLLLFRKRGVTKGKGRLEALDSADEETGPGVQFANQMPSTTDVKGGLEEEYVGP